ncbi:hypothetical protein [Nocardioides okcheonensis]|uniref:hypothetical protein n=1 Tax=Nocardioides okcheonensis TaxID=2894081 RepID=UPI001E3E9049|nr:hypothetical protein [Nocardioides okcheonensis]UFN43302.1 hypothetical protein LN652_14780 [Nocardioides okcheonensis]
MTASWLGEWPDHNWQAWDYTVSHAQLHLRGVPHDDASGPCIELLFKPVYRLATSTMSWSGLRLGLRRVTPEGQGVFFLVSTDSFGRHSGHGVIRAGSAHAAKAGLRYSESVFDRDVEWQTLWSSAV